MAVVFNPDGSIGRGLVTFLQDGTTGELDFANVNAFEVAEETEKAERFNFRGGLKTKLDNPVLQITATVTFTVDDMIADLINLFSLGGSITTTVVAGASVADEAATAYDDKWTKLAKRNLTAGTVVVQDVTDVTTYVEDTDYAIDYDRGLIFVFSAGAISDAAVLHVDYDHLGYTEKQIDAADSTEIKGVLKFYGKPQIGSPLNFVAYVSLSPSGSFSLIGDEFQALSFEAECLTGNAATNSKLYQMFHNTDS